MGSSLGACFAPFPTMVNMSVASIQMVDGGVERGMRTMTDEVLYLLRQRHH